MITCDTHALLFWALAPERLGEGARSILMGDRSRRAVGCSDIVLWEIALLVSKGRICIPSDPQDFLQTLILALDLKVLPITPEIAALAQSARFPQGDPADRLIGATALAHKAQLITRDQALARVEGLATVWSDVGS